MDVEETLKVFKEDPKQSGLVLDFDGSLSDVVADPSDAEPVAGARDVLRELGSRYPMVAVVSGRRAAFLNEKLGELPGVRFLGVYGAEEMVGGRLVQPPQAESWRGMASRLARDAEALVAAEGLQGCEVEFKDLAVSVHFRNSPDSSVAGRIFNWAREAAPRRGFSAGLGRMVVEMRPESVSKAGAVDRLLRSTDIRHLTIAGDDAADVEAMRGARRLDLQTCFVVGVWSSEEPADLAEVADLVVGSPLELVGILGRLL